MKMHGVKTAEWSLPSINYETARHSLHAWRALMGHDITRNATIHGLNLSQSIGVLRGVVRVWRDQAIAMLTL